MWAGDGKQYEIYEEWDMRGKQSFIWLGVFAVGFSGLVGTSSYYEVKTGMKWFALRSSNDRHSSIKVLTFALCTELVDSKTAVPFS